MPLVSTIPDKLPRRLIRDIKKEKYDNVILFTLALYGPHKKKELVNDPVNPIENRLTEDIFLKCIDELKNSNLIQENILNNVYWDASHPHIKMKGISPKLG